ncbi:zinc finger protein 628-like [Myzus persicae]|uniref:zinc finger protein 628-like n=1 Tax=Myzus persicae TaxID=13164 RepID=UPI000B938C99|nr:zinc finger protein 628-like [Myzus persicae]
MLSKIIEHNTQITDVTECPASFNRKCNLIRHEKRHDAVRLSCPLCNSTFNDKSNLLRHTKNIHGIARVPAVRSSRVVINPQVSVSNNEDTSSHPPRAIKRGYTEVAPQIFVPDSQAGPSNSRQVVPAPIRVNDQ